MNSEAIARPIDLMVAGTQKGGTTTLAAIVERCQGVVSHSSVEFPYFVDDEWFAQGYEAAFRRSFGSKPTEGTVVAKSAGVMYLDKASVRLAAVSPDCRLVVVLRNPVERAYSAYWFLRRVGRETAPTFEDALALEGDRLRSGTRDAHLLAYVDRGRYLHQVERLVQRFESGRVQVWLFEDLVADPDRVAGGIAAWAGLDPVGAETVASIGERNASAVPRSRAVSRLMNHPPSVVRGAVALLPPTTRNRWRVRAHALSERSWSPPPMQPETRERLRVLFEPEVDALARFLGRDLSSWS